MSLKLFFGALVAATLLLSVVHCDEDLTDSENTDDLETAEFLFWPKLFLAKAALGGKALAFSKTVHVNTAPVTYSYKPVTYTAYKWVPVPYQYTVQQPFIEKTAQVVDSKPITAAAAPLGQANVVVKAPGVSVDVVKTAGLVSVNTGVGATSSTSSSSGLD